MYTIPSSVTPSPSPGSPCLPPAARRPLPAAPRRTAIRRLIPSAQHQEQPSSAPPARCGFPAGRAAPPTAVSSPSVVPWIPGHRLLPPPLTARQPGITATSDGARAPVPTQILQRHQIRRSIRGFVSGDSDGEYCAQEEGRGTGKTILIGMEFGSHHYPI